ncbi:homeobox protein 5 [Benincasa hispida]|uniref:homeobox protein 5 n=1 Tax=Benincasa hispida TaxID=102211 RepID=UPI0018FF6B3E|nr:homeobox protein 5 [Benincasa hispida]
MGGGRTSTAPSRKVMVVVDPTRESAAALQYALSHAVIDNDQVILLHVDNPNSWKNAITTFLKRPNGGSANNNNNNSNNNYNHNNANATAAAAATAASDGGQGGGPTAEVDFLEEMKKACKTAHPKLKVGTLRVELEGKDKASMIMAQTKALGIDLLVIGQRRSLSTAILGYRRSGGPMKAAKMLDTAEYLIENSKCTCVAVQKKGQNAGYLLNTKTHRNFWLLA